MPEDNDEKDTRSLEELKTVLADRKTRMNGGIYWIVDEHGRKTLFRFNWFQEILYRMIWYLSIVLKARQVGVTTFICILFLDDVLFNDNLNAAIIADTAPHAEEIFRTKIQYPWEHLPEVLKEKYIVDTENKNMLKFSPNNSSIRVATSVRSGTYQRLHISEFGKICSKYPEKATEIVTGSLNTVHAGEMICIESTAEGAFGYFYDYCIRAMAMLETGEPLTEMDYKFFFFPWYQVPHYRIGGNSPIPKEMEDYFDNLEKQLEIKIDRQQRNWYYKKSLQQKEHMKREYPSSPQEAFEAAIEGSFYGKYLAVARQQGRISNTRRVLHDPLLKVHTWWDLGIDDSMTIWFVQLAGTEIRVIDFYENSGEGLTHYLAVLQEKREKLHYNYESHIAPHDIKVRELTTGKSRFETAALLGIDFTIAPKLSFEDGIDAFRNIFARLMVDPVNCAKIIESMIMYRKEWDDKLNVFKQNHVHDLHSHRMDAGRTGVVGMMSILGVSSFSSGKTWEQRKDVMEEKAGDATVLDNGSIGDLSVQEGGMDEYEKFGLISDI